MMMDDRTSASPGRRGSFDRALGGYSREASSPLSTNSGATGTTHHKTSVSPENQRYDCFDGSLVGYRREYSASSAIAGTKHAQSTDRRIGDWGPRQQSPNKDLLEDRQVQMEMRRRFRHAESFGREQGTAHRDRTEEERRSQDPVGRPQDYDREWSSDRQPQQGVCQLIYDQKHLSNHQKRDLKWLEGLQQRDQVFRPLLECDSPRSSSARFQLQRHHLDAKRRSESELRREIEAVKGKIRAEKQLQEQVWSGKRRRIVASVPFLPADSSTISEKKCALESLSQNQTTNKASTSCDRSNKVHKEDRTAVNPPLSSEREDPKAEDRQIKILSVAENIDKVYLSRYQQLVRGAIEYFEAAPTDVFGSQRKVVQPRQVGLRCKYCCHRPVHWRTKGGVLFPIRISRIYHTVQIMARTHLLDSCEDVPVSFKKRLQEERALVERIGGGKLHWEQSAQRKGLKETEEGLYFAH